MKLFLIYAATQVLALIVVGFHNPITLVVIPLGLVASYLFLVLVSRYIFGKGPGHDHTDSR
jgi:hypothetical protein